MDIKLLIVDDEVQIRLGIEKGIPWHVYGINIVRSAPNGVAALEIIRREEIDILITDIRMPEMDGLELAGEARALRPQIHIIILSGFSEFDYARRAIGIGVKDYLLKPIKIAELKATIDSIVKTLQLTKHRATGEKQKQLADQMVQFVLTGKGIEQEQICAFSGMAADDKILCVLIEPDTREISVENEIKEKLRRLLTNEVKESRYIFVLPLPKQVLYVVRMDITRSRSEVIRRIGSMIDGFNRSSLKQGGKTASAAVSAIYTLQQLPAAAAECSYLLNKRLYLGTGVTIPSEEPEQKREMTFYIENEELLRRWIISFQYEEALSYIRTQFDKMKSLKLVSYDLVKGVCLTLKQLLFRYIGETGLDIDRLLDQNRNVLFDVPDLFTIDDYREWICDLYYLVLKGVSGHSQRSISNAVMAAVAYISTHYQEEITVDFMSSYVQKSKNYFSYLFKKEMKVTFVEYLNTYRIEQACRLLETTLELTGEIGQKVGFRDEKYFSSVFKKIVGCPPSVYRKNKS